MVASASEVAAGVVGATDPTSDTGDEEATASEVVAAAASVSLAGVEANPKYSDQSDDDEDADDDEAPSLDDDPALDDDPSLPLLLSLFTCA